MDTKTLYVLFVSCFLVIASCEYGLPDREKTSPDDLVSASGGSSSGTGGDQTNGDSGPSGGGDAAAAGDAGSKAESDCPNGIRCTAVGGDFMCTEPGYPYLPLTCTNDADCKYGICTEIDILGGRYCKKECGPPVATCRESAVCNTLFDGASVCAQSIIWSAPPCQTQADCPFGECLLSYYGQNLCVQPCESTKVEECPQPTACIPLEGRFFCADPSTGIPDTCTADSDCDYGVCASYYDASYCTLECVPKVVEDCPDESTCRVIAPWGSYCSDKQTLLPPECDSQDDCTYGTCLSNGYAKYCTQYCSQPRSEILGVVLGRDGEAVGGVEVCTFGSDGAVPDDNCSESNENGQFAILDLDPEMPYFFVSMTKEGYQSTLQLAYANLFNTGRIFTEEELEEAADELELDYPEDDTGQIVFLAYSTTSVDGFTVEMLDQTGEGPYYADEDNLPDSSLEEASTSGWGGYFNVSEGTYYLDFTGSGDVICGDIPAAIVVSGYLTYVATYCDVWEM